MGKGLKVLLAAVTVALTVTAVTLAATSRIGRDERHARVRHGRGADLARRRGRLGR